LNHELYPGKDVIQVKHRKAICHVNSPTCVSCTETGGYTRNTGSYSKH